MYDLLRYLQGHPFGHGAASVGALLMCREVQEAPPPTQYDAHQRLRELFWVRPREGSANKADMNDSTVDVRRPYRFDLTSLSGKASLSEAQDDLRAAMNGRSVLSEKAAEAICELDPQEDRGRHQRDEDFAERVKTVAIAIDELLRNVIWHSQPLSRQKEAEGWIAALRSKRTMSLIVRDKGQGILSSFEENKATRRDGLASFEDERDAILDALKPNISSKNGDKLPLTGNGLSTVRAMSLTMCIASGSAAVFVRKRPSSFTSRVEAGSMTPSYIRNEMMSRPELECLDLSKEGRRTVKGTAVEVIIDLYKVRDFLNDYRRGIS